MANANHQVLSSTPVKIFLEQGATFAGRGYGDFSQPRAGEFVFCTAMSGIEESLTDASFAQQVLVTTVSHVGNTGYTGEDGEHSRIWAEGLVSRHLETQPSNWRAQSSLPRMDRPRGAICRGWYRYPGTHDRLARTGQPTRNCSER